MFPFSEDLLASRLGISLKGLWFLIRHMDGESQEYSIYSMKRIRTGKKVRIAWQASKSLAKLHKNLTEALLEHYKGNGYSYAYVRGRSILDAVTPFVGCKYIYTLDIKNHFPSIRMTAVKRCLVKIGISERMAFMIARLCCVRYKGIDILAQGFSISPFIANLVSELELDPVILANIDPSCTYVRYSDNLFIGANEIQKDLLITVSKAIQQNTGLIAHKLRCMPYYRQQRLLGLVVNTRVNAPKKVITSLVGCMYMACKEEVKDLEKITTLKARAKYYLPFLRGRNKSKVEKALLEMEKL